MRQAPIKPEAIQQMREILAGIVLGKLRHKQDVWHCGTAHCVAGWNTVLNHKDLYEEQRKKRPFQTKGAWRVCTGSSENDGDIAQADWGLNNIEAQFLFGWAVSLSEQIGLVELLASGQRLGADDYFQTAQKLDDEVAKYKTRNQRKSWAQAVIAKSTPDAKHADFVKELLGRAHKVKEVIEENCVIPIVK